jgi:hypothetical protein
MTNTADRYRLLISNIKRAFSEVAYPGDDDIISTPDHRLFCEECRELHDVFVGEIWTDLLNDDDWLGWLDHGMSFFSDAGWQYYLPAFLIQSIRQREFSFLYFSPNKDPRLVKYWKARINRLTVDQCWVIVEYLRIVVEEDSKSERNKEALQHWQENLERIASIKRDAV